MNVRDARSNGRRSARTGLDDRAPRTLPSDPVRASCGFPILGCGRARVAGGQPARESERPCDPAPRDGVADLRSGAAAQVAKTGPIVKAPKTGTPMHSPWFTAMLQAGKTAATLEAELAITPRSRGDGDPVPSPPRSRPIGAERYLSRNRLPALPPVPTNGNEPDATA